MPHPLTLGDPGHPDHHTICDLNCSALPIETSFSITPIAENETTLESDFGWYRKTTPHRLEPAPSCKILSQRIQALLGELLLIDANEKSFLQDGWRWEEGKKSGRPILNLIVDRVHEPQIRFQVNKLLQKMNLRTL
jgi:hypothetical protein